MRKKSVFYPLLGVLFLASTLAAQTENLAQSINDLPWTNAGMLALELFKKAEQTGMADARLWFKLGMVLYDGKSYNPALGSFRHITQPETTCCPMYKFGAYTWQGHIFDLKGRRKEALEYYKKALELEGKNRGTAIRHDQLGLIINRAWVKERLSVPFAAKGHDPQPKTE